jgi:hypothetical protein
MTVVLKDMLEAETIEKRQERWGRGEKDSR